MLRLWPAMLMLGTAACTPVAAPERAIGIEVDEDWPTIPRSVRFGEVSAVDLDKDGNVYVLHRAGRIWTEPFSAEPIAEPTVFKFSPDGRLIDRWGAGQFIMPHGLSIDPAGKIWITDVGREQVVRFTADGRADLILGVRGVSRQDAKHFGRPADVAFLGERVLVADGYTNTRVAEFDQAGRFLGEWGDFRIAHAIAVDEERIYVADRENARIQVHDHQGRLVASFLSAEGNHTYGLKPLGGGRLLAVEGRDGADRKGAILKIYSPGGRVEKTFDIGLPGSDASLGHDLALGRDGFGYVTDVAGGRVVRFRLPEARRTN